jgi:hypothetical protein
MIPKILTTAISWAIAAWAIAVYADQISTTWATVTKAVTP